MGSLHDPAACRLAGLALTRDLLAAGAQMQGESEPGLSRGAPDSHSPCPGRDAGVRVTGLGPGNGSASSVSPITVWSLRLVLATTTESGVPRASVSRLLWPHLARSVGLGPVFSPTEGRLAHRPVQRQPLPVDPLQPIVGQKPCLPECFEHTGLGPFLKTAMGGGSGLPCLMR